MDLTNCTPEVQRQLQAQMMLVGVQGESTESLSYAQTLQRIKQVGRPLRLTFLRPDVRAHLPTFVKSSLL